MRKIICILITLSLCTTLFIGCDFINTALGRNSQRIGNEYVVFPEKGMDNNDSHGRSKGYSLGYPSLDGLNHYLVEFEFLDSTDEMEFNIKTGDAIQVNSNFQKGTMWIHITQGSLAESNIQSVEIFNDETITIDLSQWGPGELFVWIVGDEAENGSIEVKLIENK